MNEPLSRYFTWAEATHSQTAARLLLDNTPNASTQAAIVATALEMDAVRDVLGHPVYVSSWYRSPKVNAAIGSKLSSQHVRGEAVDFICPGYGTVDKIFATLRDFASIDYDQLIKEYPPHGWIHVSFAANPRRAALIIDETGTRFA